MAFLVGQRFIQIQKGFSQLIMYAYIGNFSTHQRNKVRRVDTPVGDSVIRSIACCVICKADH